MHAYDNREQKQCRFPAGRTRYLNRRNTTNRMIVPQEVLPMALLVTIDQIPVKLNGLSAYSRG